MWNMPIQAGYVNKINQIFDVFEHSKLLCLEVFIFCWSDGNINNKVFQSFRGRTWKYTESWGGFWENQKVYYYTIQKSITWKLSVVTCGV